MAKISTYRKDVVIIGSDRLVGSSYDGLVDGVARYTTSSYEMRDLAVYFAGFVGQNGVTYN